MLRLFELGVEIKCGRNTERYWNCDLAKRSRKNEPQHLFQTLAILSCGSIGHHQSDHLGINCPHQTPHRSLALVGQGRDGLNVLQVVMVKIHPSNRQLCGKVGKVDYHQLAALSMQHGTCVGTQVVQQPAVDCFVEIPHGIESTCHGCHHGQRC